MVCGAPRLVAHYYQSLREVRCWFCAPAAALHPSSPPALHLTVLAISYTLCLLLNDCIIPFRKLCLDRSRVHSASLPLPYRRVSAGQSDVLDVALPIARYSSLSAYGPVSSSILHRTTKKLNSVSLRLVMPPLLFAALSIPFTRLAYALFPAPMANGVIAGAYMFCKLVFIVCC